MTDHNGHGQPVVGIPAKPPAALHGRLLQVSRMATIGEMAAGVAHELNQPLTAIANYAQACSRLLARPGADTSEMQQALTEIGPGAIAADHVPLLVKALGSKLPDLVLKPTADKK